MLVYSPNGVSQMLRRCLDVNVLEVALLRSGDAKMKERDRDGSTEMDISSGSKTEKEGSVR
jgi:hypothetical protein